MPIISPSSLPLHELALFAGAGGGILGSHLLGWRTICAVEIEEYCRRVLMARQDDGTLPAFPIWDDVQTFDGRPWRGLVDIITGGFPCQDISAGGKGAGIEGERSGLWKQMARIIREVGPQYALVENSPVLTSRGLGVVLADLAEMGYDAQWGVLGARHVGACHRRDRIWICAYRPDERGDRSRPAWQRKPQLPDVVSREQHTAAVTAARGDDDALAGNMGKRWRAIGNGQVPGVARLAWELLKPMKS